MNHDINFDSNNIAHLADDIITEKYMIIKGIKDPKDINWNGLEAIQENIYLISEGYDAPYLLYFSDKENLTSEEILQIQKSIFESTSKQFSDVIQIFKDYYETNDISILQNALKHYTNLRINL